MGEIARRQVIRPIWQENHFTVDLIPNLLSPAATEWLKRNQPPDFPGVIDLWLRTQIAASGPKIFRPNLEQCLAMEQVTARIAPADYAQPYPVMIVEFGYRSLRACPADSPHFVGAHAPEGVVVGFHPSPVNSIWLEVFFSSAMNTRVAVFPSDPTIEHRLEKNFGEATYPSPGPMTVPERQVVCSVLRLAVNAMLLLVEFGCKRLGPANESHYRRLERYVQVARRERRGVQEAENNLRLAPQLFGFSQEVVLHEHAPCGTGGPANEDEGQRRPHWRRGHWKMHAHGPGRAERKRIFIKPVLVNAHLLRGAEGCLQTIYRLGQ